MPAPELWALEGGAPWPQALDTVGNLARKNVPSLGKDPGLALKGRALGAAWEEGGALGVGGSPALECPLSRPRTLTGSPGPQLLWPARPRIASFPGRAALALSASARNRARPGGPRAAGARGRLSSGTHRGAGTQARGRDGVQGPGTGEERRLRSRLWSRGEGRS